MRALVDAIEAGAFGDVTGILHIGIGGSVLGPALLVDALGRSGARLDVRFLSNIDGEAFDDAVDGLDPATTLVVVASKTFTTAETLVNMTAALDWLREAGVDRSLRPVIAVTAAPEAAVDAGHRRDPHPAVRRGRRRALFAVERGRLLRRAGAGLGRVRGTARGRGARWTAISASPSRPPMRRLLAAFADRLYVQQARRARPARSSPMTSGCGCCRPISSSWRWNRTASRSPRTARRVGAPTAPVTWGGTGTDAQHAVFQLLHQGTVLVPVEFVAVREADDCAGSPSITG